MTNFLTTLCDETQIAEVAVEVGVLPLLQLCLRSGMPVRRITAQRRRQPHRWHATPTHACSPPAGKPLRRHFTQMGNFKLRVKRNVGASASAPAAAPAAPAPMATQIIAMSPAVVEEAPEDSMDEALVYVHAPKVGGAHPIMISSSRHGWGSGRCYPACSRAW